MKKPTSVTTLDTLGRVRLSPNFFMRDFLYSEVASFHGISNIPDDPDLAIKAGKRLCEELLEPLHLTFGKVVLRSAYRSSEVNNFCNQMQKDGKSGYSCSENTKNFARHIWDVADDEGFGAMACIIVPWFADRYALPRDSNSMEEPRRLIEVRDAYRRICQEFMSTRNSPTRTGLWRQDPRCVRWLKQFDPVWLEAHLPLTEGKGGQGELFK